MTKSTILIVDDEELIRDLLTDALNEDYVVLSAKNGEEGLKIFIQQANKISLVITDLIMPKMKGDEFVRHLRKFRPDVPVVFISGFEHEIQLDQLLTGQHSLFLHKPFDISSLSSQLKEAIK